jgi:hypothetical protein
VLLNLLVDGVCMNGYAALRLADITKVKTRGGPETFVGKALALRGDWPPTPISVALDDVGGLLRHAGAAFPLVTLHFEADDPDVCFIGIPVRITSKSVWLREISSEAVWYERPTKYPLNAITRVEVGGRYEEALAAVGGNPTALDESGRS